MGEIDFSWVVDRDLSRSAQLRKLFASLLRLLRIIR